MDGHWKILIDVIGWLGAASLLAAYGLVSSRRLEGHSLPYQTLNLSGAFCLIANTVYYGAFPSAFVNLVWVGIAVYSLLVHRNRPGIQPRGTQRKDAG